MFSLKSFLMDVGRGLATFLEVIDEYLHRPTPCNRCQQEYPLYRLISHSVSDPYGVLDRRYYRVCFSCSQELKAIVEEKQHLLLRDARIDKEISVVKRHNGRAISKGLPAALTLNQWIETLDSFEWKCAYCGGEYEELDHWIPLAARR